MNIVLREPWATQRFLEWEDRQEVRHEFDGTRIIDMTGGRRAHELIVHQLTPLLRSAIDLARFHVLPAIRIDLSGKSRYPDLTIYAGLGP